jgi:hypothetical protein
LAGDTRGRKVGRLFDGKCHRKSDRRSPFDAARVKRCGKSAPREAQATRHGKPHRVQGQIGNRGAARSVSRESETGFGYRSLRQMILSARKGEDRIRLTALPKPFSIFVGVEVTRLIPSFLIMSLLTSSPTSTSRHAFGSVNHAGSFERGRRT